MTPIKTCLTVLCALSLWACNDTPVNHEDSPHNNRADSIPHAQLPDNVTPSAYRIHLRINPDDNGMSGRVEIDVTIRKPTHEI